MFEVLCSQEVNLKFSSGLGLLLHSVLKFSNAHMCVSSAHDDRHMFPKNISKINL